MTEPFNFPANRIILGDGRADLITVLWVTAAFKTKTVVFVGIAAVVNVFVTCDQTTIIAAICDAALGERLCPPGVPSAAAPQFAVVLSEPVVPNPPVIGRVDRRSMAVAVLVVLRTSERPLLIAFGKVEVAI